MKISSNRILSKSSSVLLNYVVVGGPTTVCFAEEKNKFDEGRANVSLRGALLVAGLTFGFGILLPEKENFSKS